jgi:hypothetical protein
MGRGEEKDKLNRKLVFFLSEEIIFSAGSFFKKIEISQKMTK